MHGWPPSALEWLLTPCRSLPPSPLLQILHRDLKAENVLLTTGPDGTRNAKLADFGLHKLVRRPGKTHWGCSDIK